MLADSLPPAVSLATLASPHAIPDMHPLLAGFDFSSAAHPSTPFTLALGEPHAEWRAAPMATSARSSASMT